MLAFRILFEDSSLVVIDKPAGFHSHPPEDKNIRMSPRWNALGILQKQLGQKLYPAHRLDRGTSGALVYSKIRELNSALQLQFQTREVKKTYVCLLRGRFVDSAELNQPLQKENGMEEALTLAEEIAGFQLPIPGPRGNFRDFTLVKASPITGRYHQIRRHFALISSPIVGDARHGDKKLNREFAALTGINRLMLRCREIQFQHPSHGGIICAKAQWTKDWHTIFDLAGRCPIL